MSWRSLKRFTWSHESAAWNSWPVARRRHGLTKRRARSRSRRLYIAVSTVMQKTA